MKQFLKIVFGSLIGTIMALMLMSFLGFLILISSLTIGTSSGPVVVPKNTFLKLDLSGAIVDRAESDPISYLFGDYQEMSIGLNTILKAIDNAKENPEIKGIYLTTNGVSMGSATANEIRNRLIDFRKSGKFIIAYADNYSQAFYYMATAANKIYLNPIGSVSLTGINFTTPYLRNTLDKIGVEMQIFKVGTFKSAVEPYTLNKMSEANRLQLSELGTSTWNTLSKGICSARKLSAQALNKAVDEGISLETGQLLVKQQFVDSLLYRTDMIEILKSRMNVDDEKELTMLSIDEMALVEPTTPPSDETIAVYYAQGEITDNGSDGIIGKEVIQELKKIRSDEKIKALVVRVNSPGGSGYASEQIWYELQRIKERIPVVISMGDIAASGGYYISCAATKIVAQPNTLTGSIGVFGMIPNFAKLQNGIGINFEEVKTHRMGNPIVLTRPMNSDEKALMQRHINQFYDLFTTRCAEGRGVSKEQIEAIAEGRVWSGEKAKSIGLVDELGGLSKAIEIAAQEAELSSYTIAEYPTEKGMFEKIQQMLGGSALTKLSLLLNSDQREKALLKNYLGDWNPIQARMIYTYEQ